MKKVNIYNAKTNFSKLINDAMEGEEIIIAKAGLPLVKIVPIREKKKNRTFGLFKDDIDFYEDLEKPLPDKIIEEFYK